MRRLTILAILFVSMVILMACASPRPVVIKEGKEAKESGKN